MLATYGYDNLGRKTQLKLGNGVIQNYTFDPVSRLASLSNELSSSTNSLAASITYNPASQITTANRTGDAYAWTGHYNQNVSAVVNGLNQLTSYGTKSLTHDAKGNVTAIGSRTFAYSSENLLLTAPSTTFAYDPLARLREVVSGTTTKFAYDGLDRIAEYDASNVLTRRYVHGSGTDDPLVWYEGSGTSTRRFLSADERGSVISVTDSSGGLVGGGISKYDEYGQPSSTNEGVYGFTGQTWIASAGLWYYKNRFYDPELGRFLQTDPISYRGGTNLYAYVQNDPVNFTDSLGLCIGGGGYVSVGRDGNPIITCPRFPFELSMSLTMRWERDRVPEKGGTPYKGETPGEQEQNCSTNEDTRKALGDSDVQEATQQASTQSSASRQNWEYGFWSSPTRSGDIIAWDVGTSRSEYEINPGRLRPWAVERWWNGASQENVFFHTHIPGGALSQEDVDWANNNNISIAAIGDDGRTYCYP